jgi:hypothetical protein
MSSCNRAQAAAPPVPWKPSPTPTNTATPAPTVAPVATPTIYVPIAPTVHLASVTASAKASFEKLDDYMLVTQYGGNKQQMLALTDVTRGRVTTIGAILENGNCTPTNGADFCDSIALYDPSKKPSEQYLSKSLSDNAVRAFIEMQQACGIEGRAEIIIDESTGTFSFNKCHPSGYGAEYSGNGGGACQAASAVNAALRKAGFATIRHPHCLWSYGTGGDCRYFPIARGDGTWMNGGNRTGDKDTVVIWTPTNSDLRAPPIPGKKAKVTWEVGKTVIVVYVTFI